MFCLGGDFQVRGDDQQFSFGIFYDVRQFGLNPGTIQKFCHGLSVLSFYPAVENSCILIL